MAERRKRVLHITSWYPNKTNPFEALWIKRQIGSLDAFCDSQVLHLQVVPSRRLRWLEESLPEGMQLIFEVPLAKWRMVEWITFLMLKRWIRKLDVNRNFDVLNFHIAYPLLTYWHKLKRYVKIPVVVNEHWSAYHFNFFIKESHKLSRIKAVFSHHLPLIGVSHALIADIHLFSGRSDFQSFVVPNTIDTSVFKINGEDQVEVPYLCMASYWKYPKDPLIAIEAFKLFKMKNPGISLQLRIAGYGPLTDSIRTYLSTHDKCEDVILLGKMTSSELAVQMARSIAFLHCSRYETFSVVCAEALCCGTPVIASRVGGIAEYVTSELGVLVEDHSPTGWLDAIEYFWSQRNYDKRIISNTAQNAFDTTAVAEKYFQAVMKIYERNITSNISSFT